MQNDEGETALMLATKARNGSLIIILAPRNSKLLPKNKFSSEDLKMAEEKAGEEQRRVDASERKKDEEMERLRKTEIAREKMKWKMEKEEEKRLGDVEKKQRSLVTQVAMEAANEALKRRKQAEEQEKIGSS